MNKYAVIRVKGTQYKVVEGDEILVDKLNGKLKLETLLLVKGDKVSVGTPTVVGAKVKAKVLEEEVKGTKMHVRKFRAKSRYRKTIGFRPVHSKILIEKIG